MRKIFEIVMMLFILVSFVGVCLAEEYSSAEEVKKGGEKKEKKVKKEEKKAVEMKKVVVTATRTEKEDLDVPAYTTVLTHEELVKTGGRNLVEALKVAGGVTYHAYGPMGISHGGMNSEINLRGTRKGTLVMINGIPITTPTNGSYDLDQIPLEMVERVEIIKGAASTLYGSDAFAGVINIITRKPKSMKTEVSYEGGDRYYYNTKIAFQYKNLGIVGSYKHLGDIGKMSRNYRSTYDYDFRGSDMYNAYLTYQIFDNLSLNYSYSFQEAEFNKVYWDPTTPSSRSKQEDEKHFVNLIYEKNFLKVKGFFNYDDLEYGENTTRSSTSGVDLQNSWQLGSQSELLAGFTYKYDYGDTTQYGKHHRNNYAPFLQYSCELFPGFTATFGAREQWVDQSEGKDHDKFCPQFQTLYRIIPNFSWYINVGKAFKMPTFTQLYYQSPWMVGNPNLNPEKGWTYETGIKFRSPLFAFSLAPYYMKFKDKIEWQFNMATYKYSPVNLSEFTNKGVEYNFQYFINNNWEFSLGGYWGDPEGENGKKYRAGPRAQAVPGISYKGEKLKVNLNAMFTTNREYGLKSFQTVGANLSYRIGKGTLTMAVDNIFDRQNVISGKMSPTPYYEYYDMPRSVRVGFRVEF